MLAYIRQCVIDGTQVSRFNTLAAGLLGAPAHFFFYFIFKYGFDLPYENLFLRLTATLLCLAVLFKSRLPGFIQTRFTFFWHFTIIFVLPFVFTVNLIMNNFHELWLYWEIFMLFVLIAFVPNWLMFLFDLLLGFAGAVVFYFLSTPRVELHPEFNIPLYLLVLVFTIVAGYVFSYSNKRGIMAMERNNALKALAAGIAHEMRNPLGQIRYNLESIQEELPLYHAERLYPSISAGGVERIYEKVARGQIAVNRGIQVIEMILEEVREDASEDAGLTYLSAAAITRKAIDEYGYESQEERQRVHFFEDDDFVFKGVETMYVFVLFNLVMNALYFLRSFPDGRIDIRLKRGEILNSVTVRDTGPGVAKENLAKLFDPFYTSGRKGGTGLGLAYCKRVMRFFGGDIVCRSVRYEFTEFILTFPPVSDGDIADFEADLYAQYHELFSAKRILHVGADPANLVLIARYLLPLSVELDQVQSGAEAMEMIASRQYDLVLLDLELPIIDGYELAFRMQENGVVLSIVAYTRMSSTLLKGRAEKLGIQALLSMPIVLAELLSVLAEAIETKPDTLKNSLAGKTVLVADDSALNRMVVKNILQRGGLTVLDAKNGQEAIDILEHYPCDLLLIDIQMPVLDGLEAAKRIRATKSGYRGIPIICLSGDGDKETVRRAMESGMNDYLIKPVDSKNLLQKVSRLLLLTEKTQK
ncbi:response regulator [Chlorobium phaeobacteroides]|uniref:histidine kinase n=1 Tax=Chlorobium phaeobacteroides (strain DSM 266 / SMG 266 / 2430) TaxID=290317 RepID=A1BHE1_CHLPD|nr:response regulator [Chlorobium phaeobacteroides]ABL65818.1 integral membrane sensor hybrid histidine kinase [Chlorobium phaeobacteroides DSM 266]